MKVDIYQWRKSSYSGNANTECVEVARSGTHALLRDTQNRDRGHLDLPAAEWRAFLGALRRGELG